MADRIIPFPRMRKTGEQTVYITYDLVQTGGGQNPVIYRGAKEVCIPGQVVSWEIGEFKIHEVEDVFGVKIKYRAADEWNSGFSDSKYDREELVTVSGYARNVQVYIGTIPEEYQAGLQSAA